MRPGDHAAGKQIDAQLVSFAKKQPLPGIALPVARAAFVEHLLESCRRGRFVRLIASRKPSPIYADPFAESFDALRAAVVMRDAGNVDEAFWIVFLATHFGKHRRYGWSLARRVYGGLKRNNVWTWSRVYSDPERFRHWLSLNESALRNGPPPGRFGNHRKYESLSASSSRGTGAVVQSYVEWIASFGSHGALVERILQSGRDPQQAFAYAYSAMKSVMSFGRTARFDYLNYVGWLGLADIAAHSPCLSGATGPFRGAKLLFAAASADITPSQLEKLVIALSGHLQLSPDVLEDALCNWQKSPKHFVPFRG